MQPGKQEFIDKHGHATADAVQEFLDAAKRMQDHVSNDDLCACVLGTAFLAHVRQLDDISCARHCNALIDQIKGLITKRMEVVATGTISINADGNVSVPDEVEEQLAEVEKTDPDSARKAREAIQLLGKAHVAWQAGAYPSLEAAIDGLKSDNTQFLAGHTTH